ncbi:MAG TPA: metalloregulator ArsR/SmtB family transcription factor [Anaerolineales bacterium]|nr:metalloregulator ArsR/SmtB family transcription factor [Anaerolineales bacterium]
MTPLDQPARVFKALGHPVRLQIIQALMQDGEACVCHLEHRMGLRQAYLSQHLARLRAAGLVTDHRVGLNVFYALAADWIPSILSLVPAAGKAPATVRRPSGRHRRRAACPCPRCEASASSPGEREARRDAVKTAPRLSRRGAK